MVGLNAYKIKEEKNAFVEELFERISIKQNVLDGEESLKASTLHKVILPVYVMKHYCKSQFLSNYFDIIITNIIESEALLILGFYNGGMSLLRSALESSFKFLYYELHPTENILHNQSKHLLTGKDYREFMYIHPELTKIDVMKRDRVEKIWSDLCKFIHCDIKEVKTMTVLSEISSVLKNEEREFQKLIKKINEVIRIIIVIFFTVKVDWAKEMDKQYYDFVLNIFNASERSNLKDTLYIY